MKPSSIKLQKKDKNKAIACPVKAGRAFMKIQLLCYFYFVINLYSKA